MSESQPERTTSERIVHKLDGSTVVLSSVENVPPQQERQHSGSVHSPISRDEAKHSDFCPVERITIKLDGSRIVEKLDENGKVIATLNGNADAAEAPANSQPTEDVRATPLLPPAPPAASLEASSDAMALAAAIAASGERTVRAASSRAAELRSQLRHEASGGAGRPPKVVVVTGGSGVGKTALAKRLAERGCKLVPQASSAVADVLSRLVGTQEQVAFREAFGPAYNYLVGRVALGDTQK